MISKLTLIVAIAVLSFFTVSCKRQSTARTGLPPNTIKEFKFQGGTFKDGKINVAPGIKVESGQAKNTVTLMRPNGMPIKVSCFCVI
ncbi:MAG TPA: hypothetical protein VE056_02300, partial [Pyrinomonadaceae bacterium]|nr:hypothetical protein [Pyrinomonadaceae bacterium]